MYFCKKTTKNGIDTEGSLKLCKGKKIRGYFKLPALFMEAKIEVVNRMKGSFRGNVSEGGEF
jgi:hypothetical protein